jgi:FxLD family lantipeptide
MDTTMSVSPAQDVGDLSLDVSVVEAGPAVNALLCSTDNGCDTQANGDC